MDDCPKRDPVTHFFCGSRPGLAGPSTHGLPSRQKDVDAGDERGHRGGMVRRSPRDAP